ncbi:MAG: SufS family cysteine desulfurase [Bacteroidia bacterium]|jgi:cysteine desulfurase/selenocysteine lyase|nr:SufS family cysteine desulfurase [Bacteroidia bacterium]
MSTLPDVDALRQSFPALAQTVYGKPLIYLDNGATTQKPLSVINRLKQYYKAENANIHRGVHYLSQLSTDAFEKARASVAAHINARQKHEIIFTRGTTEAINLIAHSFAQHLNKNAPKVLITAMEHHSNLVPWQQWVLQNGGRLMVAGLKPDGSLNMEHFEALLEEQPDIVAITHVSNVLGTVNPVKAITSIAHARGIPVLVDGAQAIAHMPVDIQDIDCDFYVFSGHKAYGPMGVGVLYGKEVWLDRLPPYQFGGEMVDRVSFDTTTFNELPFKFEAGTPNVGAVLALETALSFIRKTGYEAIAAHEHNLTSYGHQLLSRVEDIEFYGTAPGKEAVISFNIKGIHPYDLGTLLDKMGIAVRTGHHCAQPLMDHLGIPGTVRASMAVYNTLNEMERLAEAVNKAAMMLR